MVDWHLCFVTDRGHCPNGRLADIVASACAAGLRAVQLREPALTTRELFNEAETLREVTADAGATFIVNGRLDIALAVGADGLHAPASDAPPLVRLTPMFMHGILGISCHALLDAVAADAAGADYVTFGPIYATPSKARFGAPQGLDKLARVVESVDIPVVAIGGITPERARACREAGASAVAVISAIATADNIADRIAEFGDALGAL